MIKLKTCPFCDSVAVPHTSNDREVTNIRCRLWGKSCMGAGANKSNYKEAAIAWNTRAIQPPLEEITKRNLSETIYNIREMYDAETCGNFDDFAAQCIAITYANGIRVRG